MKKILLTVMILIGAVAAHADDSTYSYLTFETTSGSTTSVAVESLSIAFSDGKLVATNGSGSQTFTLTELSKMYFSTSSATGIGSMSTSQATNGKREVYDIQGRKVKDTTKRGVYIEKKNGKTQKVVVR